MLKFANLSVQEQVVYFEQTAEKMNLPGHQGERFLGMLHTANAVFTERLQGPSYVQRWYVTFQSLQSYRTVFRGH